MFNINDDIPKLILDSVCDDYYYLWEVYSELKQLFNIEADNLKENNFKEKTFKAIKSLLDEELITFYSGENFVGEEEEIDIKFTFRLFEQMLNDWKSRENIGHEIRLTTTKKGDIFLFKNED